MAKHEERKLDVSIEKSKPVARILETTENSNQWLRNHQFVLPWSHYLILTSRNQKGAFTELRVPTPTFAHHRVRQRVF